MEKKITKIDEEKMMGDCSAQLRKRKKIQLVMWWLLPIIIIGGISWPYIGYMVLAMMVFFIILAVFKGRYWCGWFCPSGAFLDRILSKISPQKKFRRCLKIRSSDGWFLVL